MPKLIMFLILTSAAALGPSVRTSKSIARANDEKTIRTLNLEWLRVFDSRDIAALERIEDDDLTIAGDFGQVDKREHLESVRKQAATAGLVNRIIEKQQIRFYGNVALVTEIDRYPEDNRSFRSTGVWVKREGSWKPVHLHFTVLTATH